MGKLSRKEKAGEKWGGRKAGNLASFSPEVLKLQKCLSVIASKNDKSGEKQAVYQGILALFRDSLSK